MYPVEFLRELHGSLQMPKLRRMSKRLTWGKAYVSLQIGQCRRCGFRWMYFIKRLHFPHLDKGLPVAAWRVRTCLGSGRSTKETSGEKNDSMKFAFLAPALIWTYQRAKSRFEKGVHQVNVLGEIAEFRFEVPQRMVHDALHIRLRLYSRQERAG